MLETAATTAQSTPIVRRISPHSRHIALGKIDGRRREAKLMRDVIDDLTAHVGTPSPVQRLMIERAAALHLRLSLMDAQTEPGGNMPERQAREYVCWHNAYVRTLARLGLKGAAEKPQSLADYLTARAKPDPGAAAA
jgi:hypothetical protein